MDEISDAELVVLAKAGDNEAFGRLLGRHQDMGLRVARRVVRDHDTARELAQEAMLQAYLSLDRLRDGARFQSWLYSIVLNVCRSHFRNRKGDALSLEAMAGGLRFDALPLTGIEPGPVELAEASELHEAVLGAVKSLSPLNRAATLLYYYEQLTLRDVAATLGVSVGTIKGRLHKSRGRLREPLLPRMSDSDISRPKETTMVKVTIADVIEKENTGEGSDQNVIVLMDQEGERVLPVWVGQWESGLIAIGLSDYEAPRPLTHGFMASLLEALGAKLEEVRIETLMDDTFYATAKVRLGDTTREIDARPSDAVGLAVLTESPIYVAADVMERGGMDIPEAFQGRELQGQGVKSMIAKVEQSDLTPHTSHMEEDQEKAEAKRAESHRELWTALFGAEGEASD
jgi:RNA polymerase sigma factor (sigma-70 family)